LRRLRRGRIKNQFTLGSGNTCQSAEARADGIKTSPPPTKIERWIRTFVQPRYVCCPSLTLVQLLYMPLRHAEELLVYAQSKLRWQVEEPKGYPLDWEFVFHLLFRCRRRRTRWYSRRCLRGRRCCRGGWLRARGDRLRFTGFRHGVCMYGRMKDVCSCSRVTVSMRSLFIKMRDLHLITQPFWRLLKQWYVVAGEV
jgi:hypothetical protein